MGSEGITELKQEQWQAEVLDSDKPVLVDFWAPWCAPCLRIGPILIELAKELSENIKFVKVNVDENMDLAARHMIQGIPTLLVFNQGKEEERIVGLVSSEKIKTVLAKHIE